MKRILFFLLAASVSRFTNAQTVGIGTTTPNASAQLDVTSTAKGLLIPRMTTAQRNAIASPATGLMVFDTNLSAFYFYNGSAWGPVSSGGSSNWTLSGNDMYNSNSGNVGIGTSSPGASALLDITSTTKGILIPRMTSAQRTAIASPATGLMVYETTTNSFWYYNSSVWNQIGTGGASPWTISGTNIYNSNTGNVGIGTSSPTSKLHIAGNNMLINGANPIIQFQQSGSSTGYVQVSGDNLRMGTNSGNSAGAMVIRMNGTDRVFIDSIGQMGIGQSTPTEKLDVNGKVRITSSSGVTRPQLIFYANPNDAFNSLGPASILFYNWQSLGGGNYDYNLKYKMEFEGGVSERLKMSHTDYPNQFVLDKDGDVGINVSVPAEKLHVNGDVLVQGTSPVLKLKTTSVLSSAKIGIQFNGSSSNLGNISYNDGALFLSGRDTLSSGSVRSDLVLYGGNTGLGVSAPQEKLHIAGNALFSFSNPTIQFQQLSTDKGFIQLNGDDLRAGTNSTNSNGRFVVRTAAGDQFFVDNGGYVGLGVSGSSALSRLHVATGTGVSLTTHGYLMLGNPTSSNLVLDNNEIMARNANGATGNLILQRQGGTVRIGGTAVPSGYKFAVDGKMICEELKIKLASSGWPDYVFAENYELVPLGELEKFIRQNNHLPNIPSAAEVEKNGIEVGDMQKRMMEKIEELTLYIIGLEKKIEALKKDKQ